MKDRVNLVDNLNIEKSNNGYDKYEEDDIVPNDYHWTNIKEQKIKVGEIEEKTKQVIKFKVKNMKLLKS